MGNYSCSRKKPIDIQKTSETQRTAEDTLNVYTENNVFFIVFLTIFSQGKIEKSKKQRFL